MALAAPEDALNPVLATVYGEARADEAAARYDEAVTGYAVVAKSDPWFSQALLDLGRVYERLGRNDDALRTYARRPDDPDVLEARVRLLLDLSDPEPARALIEDLRHLRPNRPEWRVLEARATAADAPEEAARLLSAYLEFYGATIDDPGFDAAWRTTVEALRNAQMPAVAQQHLETWIAASPEALAIPELQDALRSLAIDRAAEALAASGSVRLPPDRVQQLTEARAAFLDRDYAAAEVLLETLVAAEPRAAVAWATLSDVRAARGDLTGAVQAIDAAIELDPLDADALVRRGDRLREGFGGRLDDEAVDAYRRAAERRPDDPQIWLAKARAERASGRWAAAVASYREALRLDPDGAFVAEAKATIADAARPLPTPPDLPPGRGRPATVSEAAWTAYFRAWAWREYRPTPDDPRSVSAEEAAERSWTEVRRVREAAPDFTPAMNLQAALHLDRGEPDEALRLLRQSLRRDVGQAETWMTLARVLEARDDPEAADAVARAAALDHPTALWQVAQAQAASGSWWAARETLAAYFSATTHGPHYAEAVQLDDTLGKRIRSLLAAAGGLLLMGLIAPFAVRGWSRSGIDVDAFVARVPREAPSVVRILAAVRHEVLKHHTSVLPSLADALASDATPPTEQLQWVADGLYGERGALARLDRYLEELRTIARRHEVKLNLRYRDPDLGPLIGAARRLRRLEPRFRSPGEPRVLAEALRDIVTVLHDDVYPALGHRIARLSTVTVTRATIARTVADVASEAAFVGASDLSAQVTWPDPGVRLRIDPADLGDVLANLIRNAFAAASELSEPDDRHIAVHGALEEDPITGIERLAIAVCDRHPAPLTTALIRGRYIARGLGLVVDLTTRAGGAVTVEASPLADYAKAVVVRFPTVEVP